MAAKAPRTSSEPSQSSAKSAAKKRKTAPQISVGVGMEPQDKVSTAQTLLAYGVEPYKVAAGEAYMNEKQLAHFKQLLENWKQELLQEGDKTLGALQKADTLADEIDQAAETEAFALTLRTHDRERKLLKKIHEALKLIEANDYGYCDECGVEIGLRRLEARPTATLCIDCKTLSEVKERQGQ